MKKDRYSRLVEKLSSENVKVAVSLSAGGLGYRFLCHLALFSLLEELELSDTIEEIWGASLGALVGGVYSNTVSAAKTREILLNSLAAIYKINPWNLMLNILPGVANIGYAGVISQHPLENRLRKLMRQRVMFIPFFALSYNVNELKTEILYPTLERDIVSVISASAALPGVMRPKQIGDIYFLDGSIVEPLPLLSIVNKWNEDKKQGKEKREKLVILASNLLGFTQPIGETFKAYAKQPADYFEMINFSNDTLFSRMAGEDLRSITIYNDVEVVLINPRISAEIGFGDKDHAEFLLSLSQRYLESRLDNNNLSVASSMDESLPVYNPRHFIERLKRELEVARLAGRRFMLLMIKLNLENRAGPLENARLIREEALKSVIELARQNLRSVDVIARLSGTDFVVFMPDLTEDKKAYVVESLRAGIESYTSPKLKKITAQFGVLFYPAFQAGSPRQYLDKLNQSTFYGGREEAEALSRAAPSIAGGEGAAVYPREIEQEYKKSRLIRDVCVFGVEVYRGNRTTGEDVRALIVPGLMEAEKEALAHGKEIDQFIQDEIASISAKLPPPQRIKSYTLRLEALPKTAGGETDREGVKELFFSLIYDNITRAYKRSYFLELLQKEIDRTREAFAPLSLLVIATDNIREVFHGGKHTRDLIWAELAQEIQQPALLRKYDVVGFSSENEKFFIMLPETNEIERAMIAENLKRRLEAREIRLNNFSFKPIVTIRQETTIGKSEEPAADLIKRLTKNL